MALTHPKTLIDRRFTRLAYKANYYPKKLVPAAVKFAWRHSQILQKKQIELRCNEDRTRLWHPSFEGDFKIHWEYNNIPTESEWDRYIDTLQFFLDYRVSPMLDDSEGRIVLITPLF